MRKSKTPLYPAAIILLIISFFTGCSQAEPWQFTVIDAATGQEALYSSSDSGIPLGSGGALFYSTDGSVTLVSDASGVKISDTGADVSGLPLYGAITNVDAPALITDVYHIAGNELKAGESVMIIYLDGFGWDTWQRAREHSLMPTLDAFSCVRAAAMYPTITPVNYAAMVTGEPPAINGVTKRGVHKTSCDTIFDLCAALGGSAAVVEGDTQILDFSCPQELCPDFDGDGDTDNEITDAALDIIQKDAPNLILVHLHGIDDTSHEFSPDSDELLKKLAETDGYLSALTGAWSGRIIICADHGQHTNDGNGDPSYAEREGIHGAFAASDIFIPIFTN